MAGRGPAPKPAHMRQRKNRASTGALLNAEHGVQAPDLPDRAWHPLTVAWWEDVWASPMAPEFDSSDRHGLFALACLVDDFWSADTPTERAKLAAEIRLQRQCFGLTPIDRRRLQWEIERGDEANERTKKRRGKPAAKGAAAPADPRSILHAV